MSWGAAKKDNPEARKKLAEISDVQMKSIATKATTEKAESKRRRIISAEILARREINAPF